MNSPNILIVEDNEQLRALLKMQFKRLNISCDEAQDGLQALELLEKNEYSLVLMDLTMPRMDGFTCVQKVRALENQSSQRRKIIATTGISNARECHERGFDGYLQKPVLLADIERLLQQG